MDASFLVWIFNYRITYQHHAYSFLIGANSYDLLCHEGIARSLLVFQSKSKPPVYKTVQPPNGQALQKMIVKPEVKMTILAWIGHPLDRIDTRVAN